MKDCIIETKKLMYKQVFEKRISFFGIPFTDYQKVYFWTNENIAEYLNLISYHNKSNALAVAASGDHSFNLIVKGIKDIDMFDTNRLTEFYILGIKRALILKYNYYDFITIIKRLSIPNIPLDEFTDIIKGLFSYMDEKYSFFWQSILDYNYKLQMRYNTNLNLIYILFIGIQSPTNPYEDNLYLINENNYNLLRKNLIDANISFKRADALYLSNEFNRQYDLILLSNILDYFEGAWGYNWEYDKLRKYEENLEKIMKTDGVLFLKYVIFYATNKSSKSNIFMDSIVTSAHLQDEEIFLLNRNHEKLVKDAIVLKRVK